MIEFDNGTIQVQAEEIARGLGLTTTEVRQGFHDGTITSLCEKGTEGDLGRHRLTFYSPRRRFRMIVNEGGEILLRSAADFKRDKFGQPVPPRGDSRTDRTAKAPRDDGH